MPSRQRLRLDVSRNTSSKKFDKRISSPMNLQGIDISALDARDIPGPSPPVSSPFANITPFTPMTTSSLPTTGDEQKQPRRRAQSFFSNFRASRSMTRLQDSARGPSQSSRPSSRGSTRTEMSAKSTKSNKTVGGGWGWKLRKGQSASPYVGKAHGSTPELASAKFARLSKMMTSREDFEDVSPNAVRPASRHQPATTNRPDKHSRHRQPQSSPSSTNPPQIRLRRDSATTADVADRDRRKAKFPTKRLPGVLSRNKSLRGDAQMTPNSSTPSTPTRPIHKQTNGTPTLSDAASQVSRSAPVDKDKPVKSALKTNPGRTRSEDRGAPDLEQDKHSKTKTKKDKKIDEKPSKEGFSKSYHRTNGSGFFNSSKPSEGFGLSKASRGFFSKLTRSSSSNEKVGMGFEEEYEPRLLKLPLIQQTRETRIAKSYDNCRDKTEFWMPALPWRCIDYLNGKCEEEGLYRVSGGLTMVRRWRRRFDTERDVNLLDEQDLYDASVIASLFKEWIRELPEEIFPKARQAKIATALPSEVPGKKPVPQALRDELSNLPPFNYYLLFAITCHLSLLLSHEPKNKMTLDNLYRCFNQSLKLDGRIFYTLVGDWRQCWQGCYTENDFLRAEYEYLNTPFPEYPELERRPPPVDSAMDERALTSSSGSAASGTGRSTPENQRPATSHTQPSHSTGDTEAELKSSAQRSSSEATGLSPIKQRTAMNV